MNQSRFCLSEGCWHSHTGQECLAYVHFALVKTKVGSSGHWDTKEILKFSVNLSLVVGTGETALLKTKRQFYSRNGESEHQKVGSKACR